MLKSIALFLIWYPNFRCYLVVLLIQKLKKLKGEITGKECEASSENIPSDLYNLIFQALNLSPRHLISLYIHFTHKLKVCSLACHATIVVNE
jgi:hypothetical protein